MAFLSFAQEGKIHLYECSQQFKCLRLSAILAHHTGPIHSILFASDSSHIVSCSDDMTIGVVTLLPNGSIVLSKRLHGHVSRVRCIDVQNSRILSGSDDRSLKLWSLGPRKTSSPASSSNSLLPELHKRRLLKQLQNSGHGNGNGGSSSEKPLSTMTGHSGPVTGVKLSLPHALSAAGCAVRLWDVVQGTCLKLLQHDDDSPVTTMTWTSTFKGAVTVDTAGRLRCFDLYDDLDADAAVAVEKVDCRDDAAKRRKKGQESRCV